MADEKNVVEIILKAVDKATKPIQAINQALNKALAPTRQITNQLQALEKATGVEKLSKAFGEVGSAVGNLKTQIVGTATTIVTTAGLIGGAFAFITKSSVESADGLLTLSKETGATVEGLQRLRFIASQTGSNTEDLDMAVKKFTVNMGLARAGQGALFTILSKVNPEMLRQLLHAKNTEQAFLLMLNVIQKLPKAQQQAALAQIAFGRGNLSLIATAKAGSEEYAKLTKRIEEIGIVTTAQAEEANATADAWSELWTALQRARDAIVFQTLPAVKELAKTFTQFLIDNKGAIQQWGKEFAERLPDILKGLVSALKAVATILGPIVSLFAFLGNHALLLNTILAVTAEIMAIKLVYGIWQVIKAMGLLSATMAVTPIGWVIIGLTALIGLGVLIYTYWDKIVGVWKAWTAIIDKAIELLLRFVVVTKSLPGTILTKFGFGGDDDRSPMDARGAGQAPNSTNKNQSTISVSFDNLPKGARISSVSADDVLDLSMGYAMQ